MGLFIHSERKKSGYCRIPSSPVTAHVIENESHVAPTRAKPAVDLPAKRLNRNASKQQPAERASATTAPRVPASMEAKSLALPSMRRSPMKKQVPDSIVA